MKLLVCGSRTITNDDYVYGCIADAIISLDYKINEIIEGDAKGVDKIAAKYAIIHQLNLTHSV